jgi:hypothetical protein
LSDTCPGCDGQIAFCCRTNSLLLLHKLFVLPFSLYLSSRSRTNSLLLLHKLFVLPFSLYLSSRSRTNSHLLLRTTNCPLSSDFWIVRSERTFSVYPELRGDILLSPISPGPVSSEIWERSANYPSVGK